MQIIFPILLFHMSRSLFRNPVKRASHGSLSLHEQHTYANIRTTKKRKRFHVVSIIVRRDISHIPFCFEKTAWSLADISFYYSIQSIICWFTFIFLHRCQTGYPHKETSTQIILIPLAPTIYIYNTHTHTHRTCIA